jgi:hypothetical protein
MLRFGAAAVLVCCVRQLTLTAEITICAYCSANKCLHAATHCTSVLDIAMLHKCTNATQHCYCYPVSYYTTAGQQQHLLERGVLERLRKVPLTNR